MLNQWLNVTVGFQLQFHSLPIFTIGLIFKIQHSKSKMLKFQNIFLRKGHSSIWAFSEHLMIFLGMC